MPLKPDDLKTIDGYKKAIRSDLPKLSDRGNIKFWVYKDVEFPNKQKMALMISLVDDAAAKAAFKKQALCYGLCGIKDGEVFFTAQHGDLPYSKMKTSVKELLGKPLHIPSGKDSDDDDDGGDEESGSSGLPALENEPKGTYARLNAHWKQLSPRAEQRASDPEVARAMDGIPDMLRSGKLAEAEKKLAELHSLLGKAAKPADGKSADGKPSGAPGQQNAAPFPGIVKYRTALLQFAQAKTMVHSQLTNLRAAAAKQAPDQKEFVEKLVAELEELNGELSDAVDEAMKAAQNVSSPATDAVKNKIRKYLTEITSNPAVKKADANPLGVQVTIAKTLGLALGRIKDAMPR